MKKNPFESFRTEWIILFFGILFFCRIQEGIDSLAGYADVFYKNVEASGVIPQVRTRFSHFLP